MEKRKGGGGGGGDLPLRNRTTVTVLNGICDMRDYYLAKKKRNHNKNVIKLKVYLTV